MADLCEAAYAAGLFDGEGCVQVYMRRSDYSKRVRKNDNAWRVNLSLSSVDPAPLLWIRERWGGSLTTYAGEKRLAAGHRPLYKLQITAVQAERFARDIYPYLIIKRDQMDLFLEARSLTHKAGRRLEPLGRDEVRRRKEIVERCAALKRKEYSHR